MNYLAHLYLAGESDQAIIGAMLGDFVKVDDHRNYPPDIAAGILLHRRIDAFTDSHPIVRRSKARLDPIHRHTRGVLMDMFYDHFLAVDWNRYSPLPLAEYAAGVYRALQQAEVPFPPRLAQMLPYMATGDWLSAYASLDGIARALQGLSRRLSRPTQLARGIEDLREHYAELQSDFQDFFPLLQAYAGEHRDAAP